MDYIREVKSLVDGSIRTESLCEDIKSVMERVQSFTSNFSGMLNVLRTLDWFGVTKVLRIDSSKLEIRISASDFLLLISNGFKHCVNNGEGIVIVDNVKVTAMVSDEDVSSINNLSVPFYFWDSNFTVRSFEAFINALKKVPCSSLEHHLYNGDFYNWLSLVLGREDAADKVLKISDKQYEGEEKRA